MANPIWKDYNVNLGNSGSVLFRIVTGDTVIYTGRSFMRPGQTSNEIRVNDICADRLRNAFPSLLHREVSDMGTPVTFTVQIQEGKEWKDVKSMAFINDWSYDDNFAADSGVSCPIDGMVDSRQWLIYSTYSQETNSARLTFKDGTQRSVYFTGSGASGGHYVLDLSEFANLARIAIGDAEYTVSDKCHRYVLHYVNAYGGYDSLLAEGNSMMSDSITRHTRGVEYDNGETINRGMVNYINEVEKSLTLRTAWLSDEASLRMHHLMNSTEVYVEDLASRKIYPVTLKATELQYKTYRNNGGGLVNYEFAVTLAQDRTRR